MLVGWLFHKITWGRFFVHLFPGKFRGKFRGKFSPKNVGKKLNFPRKKFWKIVFSTNSAELSAESDFPCKKCTKNRPLVTLVPTHTDTNVLLNQRTNASSCCFSILIPFYSVATGKQVSTTEAKTLSRTTASQQIVPIKFVPFKGLLRIRAEGCNNIIKWTNFTEVEAPGLQFGSAELVDSTVYKIYSGNSQLSTLQYLRQKYWYLSNIYIHSS
jgi:hypothetical protein